MTAEIQQKIYQYKPLDGYEYPLFLQIQESLLVEELQQMLGDLGFVSVESVSESSNYRILNFIEPSPKVAAQIGEFRDHDSYGPESLKVKSGYSSYRYQGLCLMVFAMRATNWELGLSLPRELSASHCEKLRVVLQRAMALALAPLGVAGFWGQVNDKSLTVVSAKDSQGHGFFIDVYQEKILDKNSKASGIHFIRPDNVFKQRKVRMRAEELFSFLHTHTCYLSSLELSVPMRQMLRTLAKRAHATIESYQDINTPTDLSL